MTLSPVTTAQMLEASRVFALREAIVRRFCERFPDVEAKAHPGKLDMGDVLSRDMFRPPAIAIAATRLVNDDRLSGSDDLRVQMTAYVITEDQMIGDEPPRLAKRDEIGIAICEAIVVSLSDDEWASWDLENIAAPDGVESQPLFTMLSYERGTVYYAVTWKQTLLALGEADFFTGGDS